MPGILEKEIPHIKHQYKHYSLLVNSFYIFNFKFSFKFLHSHLQVAKFCRAPLRHGNTGQALSVVVVDIVVVIKLLQRTPVY